jgi:hypothetical protein
MVIFPILYFPYLKNPTPIDVLPFERISETVCFTPASNLIGPNHTSAFPLTV